jgi:1-pyrroline-5-carboxylate dehydrogenase
VRILTIHRVQVKLSGERTEQPMPHNHKKALCTFGTSTPELASQAIEAALAAQPEWEAMPFNDRAAIFLRVRETTLL